MAHSTVRGAVADKGGPAEGKPPGAQVAERDPLRELLDRLKPEVEKQLPQHIKADYFLRVVLSGLKSSRSAQALANCERPTLWAAILEAARYGLMPFTDEGAIVPFGKTATFVPQYQGLVQMFYRTGQVAKVTAKLIHRNDRWALRYGDGGGFWHEPLLVDAEGNAPDRGPAVLAYCYVTLRDGSRTEVETVTRQEAIEVRDTRSKSYQRANTSQYGKPPTLDSAWHTDFDAMWLKTAVRRQAKWAPKSPELVELLRADAERDSLHPSTFEPGGPAASWPGDPDYDTGKILDGEVISETTTDGPPPAQNGTTTEGRAASAGMSQERRDGFERLANLLTEGGVADAPAAAVLALASALGRASKQSKPLTLTDLGQLTDDQLGRVNAALGKAIEQAKANSLDVRAGLLTMARDAGWSPPAPEDT